MVRDKYSVRRLNTIISNVWLFTDSGGEHYLVDTGHTAELPAILLSLRLYGIRKKGDIKAILLTHRHSDHAANAEFLSKKFGAPIYCHKNDLPFLRGEKTPKKIPYGIGRFYDDILIIFENIRPAICKSALPFEEFNNKGFIIYEVFGHTEGSIFIYHRDSRTLFSGDVLFAGIPAIGRKERLFAAVKQYSIDQRLCHRMLKDFLENPPPIDIICSGHGPMVIRDVMKNLKKFKETLISES